MHIREAAQTLAEFARTAPGCLPERVQVAIKAAEAPSAADTEDTLSTIRDLLMLDDHAAGDVIVERLLALLPKSSWTYGPRGWYREIIGNGKHVVQVYRNDDREGTPWKRSSYLHGEHPDSYGNAWEAMKASNDNPPVREGSRRPAVRQGMNTPLGLSFPTVHLNGTSGDVLLRQFKDARLALRQAVEALQGASPNARDYYVQPGGVSAAQREHEARIAKLREVEEEVYALMQGVQDQIAARVRR